MVHLRIVAPSDRSEQALALLERAPAASNVVFLPSAARKPAGDVILCDIAREEASVLIDDLKAMQIDEVGSIALEQIDSELSRASRQAERAAGGLPADAVVWEEVESRTHESIELGGTFLAFMVLACLLASIGIYTGSIILIVGAMIVGPEFGPLAGLSVAAVERRPRVAIRSLTALAAGFPVGITAAFLFTLFSVAVGLVDSDFDSTANPVTQFIADPDWFTVFVAIFAGAAGVLSLTSAKSGALVGVLISVTTIPAAANIGIAAALGNWGDWVGAMLQLTINLIAIVAAGVTTLYVERRLFMRRLDRHVADRSRPGGPTAA